jgi:VIT1/CCC1 family predicted Fe2+/Mn2+ transporter
VAVISDAVNGRSSAEISFDDIVRERAELEGLSWGAETSAAVGDGEGEKGRAEHEHRLASMWSSFIRREGDVAAHYFGERGRTGVVLTIPRGRRIAPGIRRHGRPRLHVVLDLATAGPAADLVSRYERVRVKADQLLWGSERQHVTRVVYDRLCQVMRIIDVSLSRPRLRTRSEPPSYWAEEAMSPEERKRKEATWAKQVKTRKEEGERVHKEWEERIQHALTVAEAEVVQTEELLDRAVRRVALMAYFVGMLLGIAFFIGAGVALGLLLAEVDLSGFNLSFFLTTFIAGAVGAIVSVMSRMSTGHATLEYETGRGYLRLLGAFRPLIGAIFGVALYFGIESGLLPAEVPEEGTALFFFFAFIAFLAGFSERWAQDMLVVSRRGVGGDSASQAG